MADENKAYAVLSPLKHGGKLFMPRDGKLITVMLDEAEANALKEIGVVGDVPAKPSKIES